LILPVDETSVVRGLVKNAVKIRVAEPPLYTLRPLVVVVVVGRGGGHV
jgi:hypothetical protein